MSDELKKCMLSQEFLDSLPKYVPLPDGLEEAMNYRVLSDSQVIARYEGAEVNQDRLEAFVEEEVAALVGRGRCNGLTELAGELGAAAEDDLLLAGPGPDLDREARIGRALARRRALIGRWEESTYGRDPRRWRIEEFLVGEERLLRFPAGTQN
jgi:hypothetical protein